jgi:hypothetical protein
MSEPNAGNPGAPATPPPAPALAPATPPPPAPPPAPPAPPAAGGTNPAPIEQTFNQKQVNAIAAKEKNDARAAFLAELGVDTIDAAKAVIAAKRAEDDAAKTEAQRLHDQALADATAAATAKAQAERALLEANVVAALTAAGITDVDQRTEIVPLAVAKVSDEVDAAAAVELVKQKLPQLFTAPTSPTPPPSGDIRSGTPPTPAGSGGAWDRGVARAQAENKRAGVGFDPATFSLNR